jgi:multiple sugar transport system permease protein
MSARALPWTRISRTADRSEAARRRLWRQSAAAYLYLAPALVLLSLFHFLPAFYGFYISLWKWGIIKERFLGLQNYQGVLVDSAFWNSLGVTLWYVVLVIPAEMVIGLVVAYLLFQPIRGRAGYRTAYFTPHITSTAAAAVVWRFIYNPQNGLLNGILDRLHLPTGQWLQESTGVFKLVLGPAGAGLPDWLGGPSMALVCIAIMSVWSYIGFYVVIYLAGLGNVPKELYEAARIDGANEREVFMKITLPLLSPTTFFLLIVGTVGAMQAFNQIYVMTGGGPLDTTRTVVMLVFKTFYQQTRVGYGSAMAFLLSLFIVLLTIVNFRLVGRRVHYD